MELFKLFGTIGINGADQAEREINDVTDTAEKSESRMTRAFKKIGLAIAGAFAIDKIKNFGVAVVQAAADVAAEQAAFTQIMGDYTEEAAAKVQKIADATGMVDSRLTPYMTSMTAKFKGLGYGVEDATDLASTGLTIAADAAAFWDKSLEDSMGALNSFVNGNYEGGEAIGLFANETTLASWASDNLGLKWKSLTEKEKQFARLEFAKAMQEASGAAGQAAKESDQYANVMGNLKEAWRQFKAEVGEPLLQNIVIPAMKWLGDVITTQLIPAFQSVKQWVTEHQNALKAMATVIGVVVGALAALKAGELAYYASLKLTTAYEKVAAVVKGVYALATGKLTKEQIKATLAQNGLNMAMLKSPITWIVAALVALGAAFVIAYKKSETFRNIIQRLWGSLKELFGTIWNELKPALSQVWEQLKSTFTALWAELQPVFKQLLDAIKSVWVMLQEQVFPLVANLIGSLLPLVAKVITALIPIINQILPVLGQLISQILPVIATLISELWPVIIQIIEVILPVVIELLNQIIPVILQIIDAILPVILQLLDMLLPLLMTLIEAILPVIVNVINMLVPLLKAIITALSPIFELIVALLPVLFEILQPILQIVGAVLKVVGVLLDAFKPVLDWLMSALRAVINFIGGIFTADWGKVWNGISNTFSNVWNGIKNFASGIWNGIKNTATNVWNGIKKAITTPIEAAKNAIKNIIDKIKGFFNFKFTWPKIKMPHFSIQPAGWKIGDLFKGSVPKLAVDWYAKAMDDGMILDGATIFGMNSSGQLMGGGEAGSEAIVGTNSLANMVSAAVKAENSAVSNKLDKLIEMLAMFFPQILGQNKDVILDSGVLVGQLAPRMNVKLGEIQTATTRGR